ncbi:metallophosphoesterase [Oleiharenicola lentus]|uniref:Metallophosphoesterase n=1 Tax=Oleiharenicola lentus TaxID=2508720 RepID=A0A4Q1CAD1_9BACT|nr:metallophosphoesterase [Oleiharenicola lentus]
MRFVVISDTHGLHAHVNVPPGDVLVHAGDFTGHSTLSEVQDFLSWFGSRSGFAAKILVPGNHDRLFETHWDLVSALIPKEITCLNDQGCQVGDLHIWGSPVSPRFFNWAFNRDRGTAIARHWEMIPDATDVLITHCPAHGILDRTFDGVAVGCVDLRRRIESLRLKAHFCGHIHAGYGRTTLQNTIMVNAAICDDSYRPVRAPMVVDL